MRRAEKDAGHPLTREQARALRSVRRGIALIIFLVLASTYGGQIASCDRQVAPRNTLNTRQRIALDAYRQDENRAWTIAQHERDGERHVNLAYAHGRRVLIARLNGARSSVPSCFPVPRI